MRLPPCRLQQSIRQVASSISPPFLPIRQANGLPRTGRSATLQKRQHLTAWARPLPMLVGTPCSPWSALLARTISTRRISSARRNQPQGALVNRIEAINRLDSKSSSLAARTPLPRPEKLNSNSNAKARVLAAVRLVVASAHLRDAMLGELNQIGSEDEAAKWAHRRMQEKNKLNATDAKHVEEAFRAKLLSFAIHQAEGAHPSKSDSQSSPATDGRGRKTKSEVASPSVDKSVLNHPEPRRIRDRDHVRFVARQTCLVCGRKPCDVHHLRFAQNRAFGRKVSDEFTVPHVGDIIVKCIVMVTKRRGGRSWESIRSAQHARCGSKRVRSRDRRPP